MIKEYTISNFKAFSTPATLPIKPITLIYGANSAGKSSIFQSLLMLKQTKEKYGGDEDAFILNGTYTELSSFNKIMHNNDMDKEITIRFCFHADSMEDYYLSFKMPRKTKMIKDIIQNDYGYIGVENVFKVNKESHFVLKESSLIIGENNAPIIQYIINDYSKSVEIKVNKDHPFWDNYWNLFGETCTLNIINSINSMLLLNKDILSNLDQDSEDNNDNTNEKHNLECRIAIDKDEDGKYSNIVEFKENIDKNIRIDQSQMIDLFEKYFLLPEDTSHPKLIYETLPFYYGEYYIINYCTKDGISEDNEVYTEDIFEGLNFNNDKYYYSENLSIFLMISNHLVEKFVKEMQYIGPFRKFTNEFETCNDDQMEISVDEDKTVIEKYLFKKDNVLHKVNKKLEKLNIDYNISFKQLSWDSDNNIRKYSIIVSKNHSGLQTLMKDVGFGISQVIPIVVQCIISSAEPIIIEQPELHLHPALQSELGDLFIDSAMQKKNTLLIETHSEHILLRIMRRIRETTNGTLPEGVTPIRAEDVSVVYVESVETDGDRHSIIREMPLNDQGELVKAWPGGFFEEGLREVF